MFHNTHIKLRRRRMGIALVLAGLLVGLSIAFLEWYAQAKVKGAGAEGCGRIQDVVQHLAENDTLLAMGTDFGSAEMLISKNLTIQGGWESPQPGCDPGPYDTITDAINMGGYFHDPLLYALYRPQSGDGIVISPTVSKLTIQQLQIDMSAIGGRTGILGIISNTAQVHLEKLKIDCFGNSACPGIGLNLEVRGGSRLVISGTKINLPAQPYNFGKGGMVINVYDNSEVIIQNTQVISNRALTGTIGGGGGRIIVHDSARVTVTNSSFIGNQASNQGGGLLIEGDPGGHVWLINNLFAGNTAGNQGDGLYINGPTVDILHSTIAGTAPFSGEEIYVAGGTVRVNNTIIANAAAGLQQSGGAVTEDYNLYFGLTNPRLGTMISGGHSLDGVDPQFVNPTTRDYHLGPGSAALDRGGLVGISIDFEGESRSVGAAPDIGMDERVLNLISPVEVAPGGFFTYTISLAQTGRPGPMLTSWSNANPITVPRDGAAESYPASLDVSGVTGVISNVAVTLHAINHPRAGELNVLLAGPNGQKVSLLSDAPSNFSLDHVTLTFDDSGAILTNSQITSGTYRPYDRYWSKPSNPQVFTNATFLSIPNSGPATPYPAPIFVSGIPGVIEHVQVWLKDPQHTYSDDLDILLVGPNGHAVMLMSDAGGANYLGDTFNPSDAYLVFAQYNPNTNADSRQLPDNDPIYISIFFNPEVPSGGFNLATNYDPTDSFPAPAPSGPYSPNLAVFNGTNPNGTWRLYVVDDKAGDSGSITRGWELRLYTRPFTTPAPTPPYPARLAAFKELNPNREWQLYVVDDTVGNPVTSSIAGGWTLHLTTLTQAGERLTMTQTLPPSVTYIGASGNGWNCGAISSVVTCNRFDLATLAPVPPLLINVIAPTTVGIMTSTVTLNSSVGNLSANTAVVSTLVMTAMKSLYLPILLKN